MSIDTKNEVAENVPRGWRTTSELSEIVIETERDFFERGIIESRRNRTTSMVRSIIKTSARVLRGLHYKNKQDYVWRNGKLFHSQGFQLAIVGQYLKKKIYPVNKSEDNYDQVRIDLSNEMERKIY